MWTPSLQFRPWTGADAGAALEIYGDHAVVRWLSPEMGQVPDLAAMRLLLQQWIAEHHRTDGPGGRWAVLHDDHLIGGASILRLPPGRQDWEINWQFNPIWWGKGFSADCVHALARRVFDHGIDEVYAVVRPENVAAAGAVRSNGMTWVGTTDKYFHTALELYRLRQGDLDRFAPAALQPHQQQQQGYL